jgi:glutathione S-transferase
MLLDASSEPVRRVSQTAAIVQYLDETYGPFGDPAVDRTAKLQMLLTVLDVVAEAHDTHHPLDITEHYEAQQDAARIRALAFQDKRLPKFLDWFERVSGSTPGDGLLGGLTVVDLALAQTVRGLEHAFPAATEAALQNAPRVRSITDVALSIPAVAAYRASDRCLDFTASGIFRYYPELQQA